MYEKNKTYIYKEIAEIWEKNFSFVDVKNSDPLRWYGQMKHDRGKGNCLDFGMYVAYVASKLHNAKVIITSIGLEQNTKTDQYSYNHIIPIYYEDDKWVLVNYIGANISSSIYTFDGKDNIETAIKFIKKYSEEWLPILADHVNIDYDKCDKIIKIATNEKVKSIIKKYYGKNISQYEILNYLFDENE